MRVLRILAFSIFFAVANIENFASAGEDVCSQLDSPNSVLQCVASRHPEIVRSINRAKQTEKGIEWASQIPNPEFSSQATYGKSLGDTLIDAQAALVQPLELGGKRSARTELAEAKTEKALDLLLASKEEALVQTVRYLIRLRQIKDEASTVDEAIETFTKIIKQYRSRVKLTPEQQVSVNVFSLSKADYQFRKTELEQEREGIRAYFNVIHLPLKEVEKVLPNYTTKWPEIKKMEPKGSELRLANRVLLLAEKEHEVAKSLSWPNLNIGPMVGYQSAGGISNPVYGVQLSFPLPLFNLNGGQRAYTAAGIFRAETNLQIRKSEIDQKSQRLKTIYDKSVKVLAQIPSQNKLIKQHHQMEKFFVRGLVSAALIIEAHRQILDYFVGRHAHEMKAQDALWKSYALNGSILEETFK